MCCNYDTVDFEGTDKLNKWQRQSPHLVVLRHIDEVVIHYFSRNQCKKKYYKDHS